MSLVRMRERFLWLSLIILITLGGYCSGASSSLRADNPNERKKYLVLFQEAYHVLRANYVDRKKVTRKRLFFGALNGIFESLQDPHSVFLGDKIYHFLTDQMKGTFGGLGFSIMERDGQLVILYTLPNSPARKAKLLSRDRIVAVNGKSIKGLPLMKVINKLRGRPSTKIKLTILRGSSRITKTLSREVIKSVDVEYRVLKKDVGYLKLKQFSNISSTNVRDALLELKKKKIKGLIFDLRGNPGGNLLASLYITNFFLSGEKRLVYIKGQSALPGKFLNSDNQIALFPHLPLVVLADGRSASASEIFIGAIQDHHRGTIVGSKTYGKGSVQVYMASSGPLKVGFKVTNAKWYTPKGRIINKIGLKPDIKIKLPELTLDEKYYSIKLFKNRLIERYVENHPSLTKKEIKKFLKLVKKKGIKLKKDQIIRYLKTEKYLYSPEIVLDTSYDLVLKKGLDYLTKVKPIQ